ncbi:MAG TPA: AAA family ATPase [Kofleriaceae bacterium]|nr:AAA family ATPase [Kofleriaceae bacterium]
MNGPPNSPGEHLDRLAADVRGWVGDLEQRGGGTGPAAASGRALLDELASSSPWLPLPALARSFGLDEIAAQIVAVLAAFEHSADLARRGCDVAFLAALLGGDGAGQVAVRSALAPSAPLRRFRIALVGAPGDIDHTPFARRTVRLADRIIGHLYGDEAIEATLDGIVAAVTPAHVSQLVLPDPVVALARRALHLDDDTAQVLIHGPAGTGKLLLARAMAGEGHRQILCVDVAALLAAPEQLATAMACIAREALLRDALVVLRAGAALADATAGGLQQRLVGHARRLPCPVVYSCHDRPRWLVHAVPELREVALPAPDLDARARLWRRSLGDDAELVAEGDVADIAARFALGGEAIARAARRVVAQARLRADGAARIGMPELAESARLMLQHRLGTVARRIEPGFTWDDLVLPEDTLEVLREMLGFARHRAFLLERWGFAAKLPYGRGLSAVLAGPPGTGKTMVAQLLARELGCELYLIELSQVVNKYIGETEKNLARVFDEAESSQAILFFDEADALFSRRTEVKSSNDRYANLEVNYLLQRMETYDGLTLLATNLEHGIDEAFRRRVRFLVPFEMPEPPVRERLWRSMLPPQVPVAGDIDWDRLAQRWELAGGHIKKAVVRAAARALDRGPDAIVGIADLEQAAQLEYRELGRIA